MKTATHHSPEIVQGATGNSVVPLASETRSAVDTATAAYHLNRQPQTLRGWACLENGPLRPVRIHGRLAWPVEDIRQLMGVAAMPAQARTRWTTAKIPAVASKALPVALQGDVT